jgi:hypothetical protein
MITRAQVGTAAEEFAGADLGDRRREERLEAIVGLLDTEPAKSFPRAMGSDATLEAFYRFINNDGFGPEDILAPHIAATMRRARAVGTVVAIHDTTHVEYGAKREDLGPTTGKNHFGFLAHAVLLLAVDAELPLGVGHLETIMRTGTKWPRRKKHGQRARVLRHDKGRESLRWTRGVDAIEQAKGTQFEVIHVTDAEGDFFELFALLHARHARFVIRAGQLDRAVLQDGESQGLREVIEAIRPAVWRDVELGERKYGRRSNANTRRRHPPRAAHCARLAIGAGRVVLKKTRYSGHYAAPFELNVVRVWEPEPPVGQPAVEWVLMTTEDISSHAALQRVVDIYRKRWTIEEFFKALKSGCSLEKRQVESYAALCKVLALFVPIAYRLLLLRGLERAHAQMPATQAFSQTDLLLMVNAPSNRKLPPPKTVTDAMIHLARLGGHIRNNGRPGWQTLAWGYEKLLTMRLGWELAMEFKK